MLKSLNRETPIEKNQILKEKMIDISCLKGKRCNSKMQLFK